MSETPKTWYSTGYDGIKQEEQRQLQRTRPDHFWVPAGGKKNFVFVDENPACVYEHNPKIDGDFKNWTTCLQGCFDDVACCTLIGSDTRYFVGYYTVVNLTEFVDGKGNKHQYQLQLLPAKTKTLKKFQRKQADRKAKDGKGLVGAIYESVREDAKSPNVGDEFNFDRDADMAKLFALVNYRGKKLSELWAQAKQNAEVMERIKFTFQIQPDEQGNLPLVIPAFNYANLLQPRDPKEIRAWLAGKTIDKSGFGGSGSSGPKSGGATAEDVPF